MSSRRIVLLLLLFAFGCTDKTAATDDTDRVNAPLTAPEEPAPVADEILASPTASELLPEQFNVIWQTQLGDFDAMVERRIVRVVVPYGGYQFYYENGRPRGAVTNCCNASKITSTIACHAAMCACMSS